MKRARMRRAREPVEERAKRRWTARQVAIALGVPSVYITYWIRRGWMTAHKPINDRRVLIRTRAVKRALRDPRVQESIARYRAGRGMDGEGGGSSPESPASAPLKPRTAE